MPRTHRPTATLLLTLGLTACADEDPVPKFAEEPTAAATPVEKKETPKEFIRRWNDEQNTLMTGDSDEWRAMTSKCPSCIASADRVDGYYAAGGYVRTEGRKIVTIERFRTNKDATNVVAFRVEIDSAPTAYRTASDAPEQRMEGGLSTYEVQLVESDDSWRFLDYWELSS